MLSDDRRRRLAALTEQAQSRKLDHGHGQRAAAWRWHEAAPPTTMTVTDGADGDDIVAVKDDDTPWISLLWPNPPATAQQAELVDRLLASTPDGDLTPYVPHIRRIARTTCSDSAVLVDDWFASVQAAAVAQTPAQPGGRALLCTTRRTQLPSRRISPYPVDSDRARNLQGADRSGRLHTLTVPELRENHRGIHSKGVLRQLQKITGHRLCDRVR